jgi:esterase/lipase
MWVWGQDDIEEFMKVADQVTLNDVTDKITVPFLITHGINDRQINVKYAHQSYEQAVNSPKRELRIFTPEEGGTEHISLDNLPVVASFIADWVTETFTELHDAQ